VRARECASPAVDRGAPSGIGDDLRLGCLRLLGYGCSAEVNVENGHWLLPIEVHRDQNGHGLAELMRLQQEDVMCPRNLCNQLLHFCSWRRSGGQFRWMVCLCNGWLHKSLRIFTIKLGHQKQGAMREPFDFWSHGLQFREQSVQHGGAPTLPGLLVVQ